VVDSDWGRRGDASDVFVIRKTFGGASGSAMFNLCVRCGDMVGRRSDLVERDLSGAGACNGCGC